MSRKIFVWILATLFLTSVSPAQAQQAKKVHRLGYLVAGSPSSYAVRTEAFRSGLVALGYVEGKNLAIEYRYTETSFDQLAAELVQLKVGVIVTGGTPAALAAKRATSTIPIVVALSTDTVGAGLVDSLARPGGNVTGLTSLSGELSGKRLELIKEVHPKVASVVVLANPANPSHAPALKESEAAARALGIRLQALEVRAANELDSVILSGIRKGVGGLILLGDGMFSSQRRRIVELVAKRRLIAVYTDQQYVELGGLISYGVNIPALFHRAATYVDKILKGTKPADIPVEQPMKFELVINLNTANQLGVTIPQWTLMKADRVIR